jgi:hypothetical protein
VQADRRAIPNALTVNLLITLGSAEQAVAILAEPRLCYSSTNQDRPKTKCQGEAACLRLTASPLPLGAEHELAAPSRR